MLSLTKKARKITAMQYNGKQIHSGMDEPSGRYAKTIVFASTSSFFQWWKIIRARNINAAEQGSYLAGEDFISGQWYFCPATVRADNNSGLPQKHSFCGKREQSPISDAFADRQNEPKGELWTPSQAMGAARSEKRRGEIPMECSCKTPSEIASKQRK